MSEPGGYVSPYGKPEGLTERLRDWVDRACRDKSSPWPGTGILEDIKLALQFLDNREWLENLRATGDDTQRTFAGELLRTLDTVDAMQSAADRAAAYPGFSGADPVQVLEKVDDVATDALRQVDRIRDVLVEAGALADGDTETPVPDLLRALLA